MAERYFILQTLAGAWPIEIERIEAYLEKALREAKRNSNWIEPNTEWEEAAKRYCRALLANTGFRIEFDPFVNRVRSLGQRIVLGQLVLKLTSPGVPDIYQGDELQFRALVDPDNRRPVDWRWYQAMLRRLMGGSPPTPETMKQFLTLRLLGLRGRRPEVFANGAYEPVEAGDDCVAFTRGGEVLVVVGARERLGGELHAPSGRWRDLLRGDERSFDERQPVARLLGRTGFAVFERL
jgi:(1->4)-alpha-D-glucan 1-alpha-D-glucosylmutase